MKSSRRSTLSSYLAASGLLCSAALVGARGGTFSQAAAQENDALS